MHGKTLPRHRSYLHILVGSTPESAAVHVIRIQNPRERNIYRHVVELHGPARSDDVQQHSVLYFVARRNHRIRNMIRPARTFIGVPYTVHVDKTARVGIRRHIPRKCFVSRTFRRKIKIFVSLIHGQTPIKHRKPAPQKTYGDTLPNRNFTVGCNGHIHFVFLHRKRSQSFPRGAHGLLSAAEYSRYKKRREEKQ